jgi:hypothetical protein
MIVFFEEEKLTVAAKKYGLHVAGFPKVPLQKNIADVQSIEPSSTRDENRSSRPVAASPSNKRNVAASSNESSKRVKI